MPVSILKKDLPGLDEKPVVVMVKEL